MPGPGAYAGDAAFIKSKAPNYGFGSSKRPELAKKSTSPGPGAYKIPSRVAEVPDFAMPSRSQEHKYV